jgi:hypothetical protein
MEERISLKNLLETILGELHIFYLFTDDRGHH